MKLFFSLCLLSFSLCAREIVVIHYHPTRISDATFLKSTLINQLHFPSDYIQISREECGAVKHAISSLCVLQNGEVEVKQIKTEVMKKLLQAFGGEHE